MADENGVPMHAVTVVGYPTEKLGITAGWAQNLTMVFTCDACSDSFHVAGEITIGAERFSLAPGIYGIPFQCPTCKRRFGIFLCQPDVPPGIPLPRITEG